MINAILETAIEDIKLCDGNWQGSIGTRFLPKPKELEFTVDDYVLKEIETAQEKHNAMRKQACIIDKPFTNYGKQFTKDHSVHPDAVIQMAIQLAYYRLHKRCVPTYESATTRQFHHGRTETMRSCNSESKNFVEAMCDNRLSMSTKARILSDVCENHNKLMNECCDGQGFDRHLLGLQIISQQEGMELPKIFKDKAWKLSGGDGNFVLSTSLSGYNQAHGGMGPMIADGYGVFYTTEKDRINFVVSTFGTPDTDCGAMHAQIEQALYDIRDTLISAKL